MALRMQKRYFVIIVIGAILAVGTWRLVARRRLSSNRDPKQTIARVEPTTSPACSAVCPNRVLVKLDRSPDKADLKYIQTFVESRLPAPVTVKEVGGLGVVSINAPGINVDSFVEKFGQQNFAERFGVVYVEPDFQLKLHSTPGDQFFPNQWGLLNQGQSLSLCGQSAPVVASSGLAGADINVTAAWSKPRLRGNFVVAILDNGVDLDHPDISKNLWRAPRAFDLTVGGVPIHCDAGSRGFNSVANICDPREARDSHGTNLAGIVGAVRDDVVGTVGVDPDTQIMAIKAFDDGDTACVSQIANAIDFLVQVKQRPELNADIRVINNSYGLTAQTLPNCQPHENCDSRTLKAAVARSLEGGMLFVASDGNDTRDTDCIPEFPAGYDLPNIVSVAASTNHGELADLSNFGIRSVHLVAPGTDICAPGIGGYGYHGGTSMAAPFVSGSASLLLSRCGLSLSYADLKNSLINNADAVLFHFRGNPVPGRRLNVGRAVLACP